MGNGAATPSGRSRRVVPGGHLHAARANQENISGASTDSAFPVGPAVGVLPQEPRGGAAAIAGIGQAAGGRSRRRRREIDRAPFATRQIAGARAASSCWSTATRRFWSFSPLAAAGTEYRGRCFDRVTASASCRASSVTSAATIPRCAAAAVNPYTMSQGHARLRYLQAKSLAAYLVDRVRRRGSARGSRKSFCPAERRSVI